MDRKTKQLSNPFSTGGGGAHFEAHILASFVVLMLSGGYAPCLPCWPITKIKPQGKIDGYDTDDLIVFVENKGTQEQRKLLGQVKHAPAFTKGDIELPGVFQAAWDDFNNPQIFKQNKDVIALITGPLSKTDFHNVHWLLNQARHTANADEFYRHVERAKFSPAKAEEKLGVIQYHLQQANYNSSLSQEDLYSFLRHFHLFGYDLGDEVGVTLSLLYSHIAQFNQQAPQWVWSRAVDLVQTWNKDAGTITRENLPEDLRDAFKRPVVTHIPSEFVEPHLDIAKQDWRQHKYAIDLALLLLVGGWNEKNEADISTVAKITGQDYSDLAPKIQELLQVADSPLSLHNGIWKISERINLWEQLGSRIFDQHLEVFKECAVSVLTERDPAFELPKEDRFAASIYGKTTKWSPALKKGLAEGLALLGSHPNMLDNCSLDKAEITAVLAIRDIFADADWVLWGSLNNLLPVLAEAAPSDFLGAVENALQVSPCPFDDFFAQEGSGGFGDTNYMTGLLWALETLAWDAEYLIRVCVLLGELASRDPGGNWRNRPGNSLSTIILPWYPQTLASFEKRKTAVKTLCNELPDIGWKLVLGLLPRNHGISMGSHKPSWRNPVPDDWKPKVTNQGYWEEVSFYAELAVSSAGCDIDRLVDLIGDLENLTDPSFKRLLNVLSSDGIVRLSEENRYPIWDKLRKIIFQHRQHPKAKWALPDELLASIEEVANKIKPSNPFYLYRHVFVLSYRTDKYEKDIDWKIQYKKNDEHRQEIIGKILSEGGIQAVINFSKVLGHPTYVGYALASVADEEIDNFLLPAYLKNFSSFIESYVGWRRYNNGWSWVDGIEKLEWSQKQVAQLLIYLPFNKDTWERAADWLGDEEREYWLHVDEKRYRADENWGIAVDKLLEYGRPYATINCLAEMLQENQPIDVEQCIKALLAAASSSEAAHRLDYHHAAELIEMLQKSSEIETDDLFKVEWAYLPLLDGHHGISPKTIENNLANHPESFCQTIQLVYCSTNSDEDKDERSEQKKNIAQNALRLLENWRTPPGIQEDGSFDQDHFSNWLERTKELCFESGHLEVALYHIGEVLIHSPADDSGLWINKIVADALNAKDADDMRNGFYIKTINSRGVHRIDPTGKPERELAEKYRQQAEDVENAGYHRLAATLRDLAKSYDRDAERIISEHTHRKNK
ncbi:MAG: hypothetical protein Q3M24_18705 [Candidatus Electrothrix aestuarii]|uniref:Uncharacterized protein n=1 Tax=Candidatus Electrothrix aestuarii TaxID=3062594 RepID=A0AAU8LT50_9BACT|nr:hypothetical protein [Candidatus Electrothrix aestuarii]